MTLKLILLRHAKSSWDDPLNDDHSRTLNDRGRRAASAIGRWLKDNAHEPELALVSSATRTQETWELVQENFATHPATRVDAALYLASPDKMLSKIQDVGNEGSLVVVAHNPGISILADMLAIQPPQHIRFADYPTGATTVLEFDVSAWSEIDWNTGRVVDFTIPREL